MELVYSSAFLDAGFSLQKIRKALAEARSVTGQDHPFANKTIYIAPNDIYVRMGENETENAELRSLLKAGQQGIAPVILDISKRLDFDETGNVCAWHPKGKNIPIVVDPFHVDGDPRIANTRIPTSAVLSLWRAEKNQVEPVANAFGLSADTIRAIVDFEMASTAA